MGIGDHQRHTAQAAQAAARQRAKEVEPEGLGLGRTDAVERLDSPNRTKDHRGGRPGASPGVSLRARCSAPPALAPEV